MVEYRAEAEDGRFYPRIRLYDADSGEEQAFSARGNQKSPRFSPDGSFLAYLSDGSGEYQICYLDGAGASIRRQPAARRFRLSIAPDSRSFLFEANLWDEEVEAGLAFVEMTPSKRKNG